MLRVRGSGDVGKIDMFFDGGKDSTDWFSRMVQCLLDNFLALEEFMWHQLTLVVFEVSDTVRHSVIDGIFLQLPISARYYSSTLATIRWTKDCSTLVNLQKKKQFLGVGNSRV